MGERKLELLQVVAESVCFTEDELDDAWNEAEGDFEEFKEILGYE